jgi:hypothetical protein
VYFQNPVLGTIFQYKADGTADGSISGGGNSTAVDNITSDIVVAQGAGGAGMYVVGKATPQTQAGGMAAGARNGSGCITEPTINFLSCIDLAKLNSGNLTLNSVTVGSQPWSFAMGVIGGTTHAYVLSRDGTPTLWDVNNIPSGPTVVNSEPIPGTTPVVQLEGGFVGGWHVVVFDTGPATGTIAALFGADKLLVFFNASTLKITQSITLSGIPFRIATDAANGNLIVAYADPVDQLTTFAKVNPTTGVVTALTSTSDLLAVGFRVSADGKSLYSCQGTQCQILSNQ